MDIDVSKVGATTIMSCGTTNVGHYAYIQQGLSGNVNKQDVREIFDALAKYAPIPPDEGWDLIGMDLSDYKSFHNEKFYKIHVVFKFHKDHGQERYSKEVGIAWHDVQTIYALFRKLAYQSNVGSSEQSS